MENNVKPFSDREGFGEGAKSQTVVNTLRTRDGGSKTIEYGRKKAILLHCTECMGWETHPKHCTSKMCALYPYRGITMETQHSDAPVNAGN